MTTEAYEAKRWLNRNYKFALQVEADIRLLETIESRLSSAVSSYKPRDGKTDSVSARKRHEANLDEYSTQKAIVEKEVAYLHAEDAKTRKVIEQLTDAEYKAVAIDRYITRLRWDDIAKVENYSRSSVFRIHKEMLNAVGEILRRGTYFEEGNKNE